MSPASGATSVIVRPFWNGKEGRPRALWRLVLQAVLFLVATLLSGVAIGAIAVAWLLSQPGSAGLDLGSPSALVDAVSRSPFGLAITVAEALMTVLSVWLAAHFLDRRRFVDLGLHFSRAWWLDFGFGLALGALLMVAVFLGELAAGWITVSGSFHTTGTALPFAVAILGPLLLFVGVGIREELLSRGYQLRNLAEGLNLPFVGPRAALALAWLLSSAVFGLLHAGNPNATAVSTANLVLAGLFLGLGYVLTGELAIPIGLHITWNFFQGNVFGFPVSGTQPAVATFVTVVQGGPDLWTGGAFGPEAGLVGIGAMLLGSLLTVAWVRQSRGRVALCTALTQPPARRTKRVEG